MDVHLARELLDKLGSSLENLETQQAALLQFLKDKGIVTEEQLAPYLNQAGDASSVRWRAARARLEHIFSAAEQKEQEAAKRQEERQAAETQTPHQRDKEKRDDESRGASKASDKRAAKQKEQAKEEKTEVAEMQPEAPVKEAKGNRDQGEPSPQRRGGENAA
jgi:hypothetical protein